MKRVQPEELSAFLDGELSAQRMREVQQRIDGDDALRVQFEALRRLDRKWHAAAFEARFDPSIQLPRLVRPKTGMLGFAAIGAALAAVRLMSKVLDAELLLWTVVNAVLLALLLAATAWLIRREGEHGSPSH
jgi:anti-sigma factor RsiW